MPGMTSTQDQAVDLVGEVRAADVDGRTFILRMDDGTTVHGSFSEAQEAQVVAALRYHNTRRLRVRGVGEFSAGSWRLRTVVEASEEMIEVACGDAAPAAQPPIWEVLEKLGAEAPPGTWDGVPTDLAANIDHYLYGGPKRG